jgi:serine/threonine protein kinase/WD40 repeat protein/tetratricopeptide (TPR) repeat protein
MDGSDSSMTPSKRNEETLFLLAMGKHPIERGAFLERECAGDLALRQRLDALLAAHDAVDSLGPFGAATLVTHPVDGRCEPADATVGTMVGRYKLLARLGEGGCGTVYVAEQTEPVRRRVALKVIKLGMDTKAVVARFEAERQALAMMDHPNIAKVLDAGTTDAGRPYFVMELVRGIRITEYCDQAQLPARERLDLFIKVCRAVQHAHQKGMIHRDIKPSNILVTLHDGAPVPKVIDFGIAKATEGRLADATVYTQLHQFIGTPAHMSPEQAEMSGLDIDTRSDIYSLGVLLYELLTGKTPFDAKELMASGIDAMRRTIREKEPARPSTRLATLRGDELTTTARRRSLDAPRLIRMVEGDLDWIVMKCLEKDRSRRYETANGLAADLDRHLKDEPVVARPPSAGYRIQKALRRNKLIFASGAAVVMSLIAGLGISIWQAAEATRARKEAEAARSVAVQRATGEAAAKVAEAREREEAQRAYARAAELLCELEIQKAGELFVAGRPSSAVAYLGRVMREHPTNLWVANRLVSELTHLSFAWPRKDLAGHRGFRFSQDGRHLLTLSNQGLHLWNPASGQPVVAPLFKKEHANLAEFSRDGQRMVTTAGHELYVYDISRSGDVAVGQPVTIGLTESPVSCQFSPDGTWVVTASPSLAEVWDAQSGQRLFHPISGGADTDPFTSARFSPDARRILTTTPNGVQVWDRSTGQLEARYSDDARHPFFGGAHFSPDTDRWMTSSSHMVHTWDTRTGQLLAVVSPGAAVTQVEFSPDGQRILTSSLDRVVRIWDSGPGQPLGETLKHDARVTWARFSPNGRWVLTFSADAIGRVWDAGTGRLMIDALLLAVDGMGPLSSFQSADLSPDGRFVAVQTTYSIRMWELSMAPLLLFGPVGVDARTTTAGTQESPGSAAPDTNRTSRPPPAWFPELVEAVAGQRLTEKRTLQPVSSAERSEVRSRLANTPGEDSYARLARWLFADRSHRTVSPSSTTLMQEYVDEHIRRNNAKSLEEALRLSPANGLAMSRLAGHLAAQDPLKNPRRAAEVEFFSRRALELTTDLPRSLLIRAEVLAAVDQLQEALRANERAIQQFPDDPELLNQKGTLLERAALLDQAEPAYSRAIALAQRGPEGLPEKRARYLLNRSDARARLGRSSDAQADRLAGLRLLQALPRDDSPQWGGNDPGRNLYASASGLPDTFIPGQFHLGTDDLDLSTTRGIRFAVPLGSLSIESPAVAHGKIFVGTNNDKPRDPRHVGDRSILMCLDEESGSFLWQLVIPKLASGKQNDWNHLGLLSTLAIEGNRVYLVTTRCEVL